MINIDKIKDPYAVIAIVQWIKSNKQLFKLKDSELQAFIDEWLEENKESIRGSDGLDGKSIVGEKGSKGEDGISITDAKITNDYLVLTFSDGSVKRVKMPKTVKYLGGGSGGASTAKEVTYDNSDSALESTNVKEALDELAGAGSVDLTVFRNRTELEGMFNAAYSTAYSELIYVDGNISQIIVHEDDTKATLLFTKDITYTSGNISQVLITNEISTQTLTKDITYDVDGNISELRVA